MKAHRNVTPRQEALAERHLCAAVAALHSADECRAFFRDLCTPAELQAMADRWAVVEFLKRGLPYREIHRTTGVSVTTIGRVARFLANGNGGYALAAQRLEEARQAQAQRTRRAPRRAESAPGGRRRSGSSAPAQSGSSVAPSAGPSSGEAARDANTTRLEAARNG